MYVGKFRSYKLTINASVFNKEKMDKSGKSELEVASQIYPSNR